MAGRRHHYLPRFLQRPFAFRQKGKQFYVYAHHRAHGAFATNVMELGQELDFYGGPHDTALDDEITQGERQLALTVNRLNAGEAVLSDEIATLVSAISFRTKAMRKALTDLIPPLMEAGRHCMVEGRRLQRQLHESLHNPKKRRELICGRIREDMGHLGREQRAKVYALMLQKWKRLVQENEERMLAEAESWAEIALEHAVKQASDIGDSGYLSALSKGPDMPERAKRMAKEMTFEVWEAPDGEHFLLGDCGSVALFTDGKARLTLGAMDSEIEMEMVFLPLSPARCIVARKPGSTRTIDVSGLNRISAAASSEFFISYQQDNEQLANLRQIIGSIDPIATKDEIIQALARD